VLVVQTIRMGVAGYLTGWSGWRVREAWIQNRISPIIKAMTFQGEPGSRELLTAIQCFKDKDGAIEGAFCVNVRVIRRTADSVKAAPTAFVQNKAEYNEI
jgi:hypothetical protein